VSWRVRARLSRIVSDALGWLASRSPRIAFLTSDMLGALRAGIPTRTRRRIWMNHMRTQVLAGWIDRGGTAQVRALVRPNEAIARLRPPMIIGTFHIGPTLGLGVLSEWLDGETLVLRGSVGTTDQQRAATFHRAIEMLRANGSVVIALDPNEAQRIAVPFLGRTLHLARGPFAMARIARVPIVPLVARWNGNAIELIVGEPLPISDDEQSLAESAGRWLEGYLREWPGEISYRIRELMRNQLSPQLSPRA
jgi:hypothetical protein